MKTSHAFSILFWINSSRATKGNAGLFARVTVNSKRVNIGLKRKVSISPWNSKTKKASGTAVASKQLKTVNVISKRHATPDGHYGSSQDQRPKKINGYGFHQLSLAPFIFDFKQ